MALRRLDAFDHGLHLRCGGGAHIGRIGVERALQIVGDRKHVAGEFGHGILRGLGLLALGAAAHVLGIRKRTQQAILEVGRFRFQCLRFLGRGRLRFAWFSGT